MTRAPLLDARRNPVPDEAIARLQGSLHGEVIRPGDPAYDAARRIWNASIDRHPGAIARCTGTADVIAAVRFAREHAIPVAIRGGGHNVGGRAVCDDGLVIDLSRLRSVHVDARHRTARVQGGATLGDVDRETHVHGLAVPAGVVSKTGMTGLTLGGGVGWLVRKHGLACDNVVSFEVVTAEGQHLVASEQDHPDLFWALRGGGGNFGVVTWTEYRAHPVGTVLGGLLVHPRARAAEVLRAYRDFIGAAPEELTAYAGLLHDPQAGPVVAVIACYAGDVATGERVLRPLRQFGAPLLDAIQPMPFPQMQVLLDGGFPDGNQNYWKSAFLRELTDEAIDIVVDHAGRAASPLSAVVLEYYGGAASRVPVEATAFAHREAQYDLLVPAQWTDPRESDRHVAWARGLAEAMHRFSSGAYLLNFLGQEAEATIRAAFGPNYDRLVAVKTRYDPTNFFRHNQNIRPAA